MPTRYGRNVSREHAAKPILRLAREAIVRQLELANSNDPGLTDLLADLRALKRVRDQIAEMPEHAKQAFGFDPEDFV